MCSSKCTILYIIYILIFTLSQLFRHSLAIKFLISFQDVSTFPLPSFPMDSVHFRSSFPSPSSFSPRNKHVPNFPNRPHTYICFFTPRFCKYMQVQQYQINYKCQQHMLHIHTKTHFHQHMLDPIATYHQSKM